VNNQLDALMRSNGLNIDNWDAPIYRVFSLRWFKDMITQRNPVRLNIWHQETVPNVPHNACATIATGDRCRPRCEVTGLPYG